jgi:hypothetical protein
MYPDATNYNSGGFYKVVHTGPTLAPTTPLAFDNADEAVGETLTVDNIDQWSSPSPDVYIAWYRDGVATNTFDNEATYLLSSADLGKTITAKVTATSDGYGTYTTTLTVPFIYESEQIESAALPVISGTPKVGNTPSVSTGTLEIGSTSATGLTYAYQWYLAGTAIPGATSSSYVLSPGDEGQVVDATVTSTKPLYLPSEFYAPSVDIDPGNAGHRRQTDRKGRGVEHGCERPVPVAVLRLWQLQLGDHLW